MAQRICIEPECEAPHRSQGFCNKHYKRRMKAGLIEPSYLPPIHERLADRIAYDGDCWLWTGSLTGNGYGRLEYDGDAWLTHRLVYTLTHGPIPDEMVLDHLCKRITCCNPDHLDPVPQRENILRGDAPNAVAIRSGRCKRGHAIEPGRDCLACKSFRRHSHAA